MIRNNSYLWGGISFEMQMLQNVTIIISSKRTKTNNWTKSNDVSDVHYALFTSYLKITAVPYHSYTRNLLLQFSSFIETFTTENFNSFIALQINSGIERIDCPLDQSKSSTIQRNPNPSGNNTKTSISLTYWIRFIPNHEFT